LGTPTTADNCSAVTVTNNAPSAYPIGNTAVTWTATDASGNVSTAIQLVIINDLSSPTISAPTNVMVSTNSGCSAQNVNLGSPVFADNCAILSITNNAPSIFPIGTTIVTWTVTDASGNAATAAQTVTVIDQVTPIISAPANVSVTANAACGATGISLGTPTVGDNCSVSSVINNAPAVFPIGSTLITWTVTDVAGNSATATQTVTVTDVTAPTISAPGTLTIQANASCVAFNVNLGNPVTTDNCTVSTITNNAPTVFPIGTTTVTWTVTDASGNTATATQTVTVIDQGTPSIVAPANLIIPAGATCSVTAANIGLAFATDNCTAGTVTNNAPAVFPVGITTVTWTVTDAAGNSATAAQTITVIDLIAPTIVAPATVTTTANSACNATGVSLGTPTTADNCSAVTVTNNAPVSFPVGTTTVTWIATDASGNSTSASQLIIVTDAMNPTIVAPTDVTTNANSACSAFNVNLGTPATSDNCSVANVTNNAPSVFPIGTTTVTWTVTDESGNTSTASQTVTVTDIESPTLVAPSSVSTYTTIDCFASGVILGNPVVLDNCAVSSVTNDAPLEFPIGITIVTVSVKVNSKDDTFSEIGCTSEKRRSFGDMSN
jgi:hypothetical protein